MRRFMTMELGVVGLLLLASSTNSSDSNNDNKDTDDDAPNITQSDGSVEDDVHSSLNAPEDAG